MDSHPLKDLIKIRRSIKLDNSQVRNQLDVLHSHPDLEETDDCYLVDEKNEKKFQLYGKFLKNSIKDTVKTKFPITKIINSIIRNQNKTVP